MPPPAVHDDDLDDLDDVLDEFSAPSSSRSAGSAPIPAPAQSSAPAPPSSSETPAPPAAEDFPDPDDDALPEADPLESAIDPLAKDLEEGMKALFAGLAPGGEGGAEGEDGELDEGEFRKIMEDLMKGDFGGAGGLPGAAGEGGEGVDDEQLRTLMSALGMGGASGAPSSNAASGGEGKAASHSSSSSTFAPPAAAPANFQEAIAASMSKMKDSSSSANAAAESSRPGQGGDAGMAAMLAQLAGMPDPGNLDGSEEGLQGMIDEMMKQLMSREMLYEPLKELADKYPAYLKEHADSLSSEDLARYKKQETIVRTIVTKFEEPGADKAPPYTPEEEEVRSKRMEDVVDLVAKMNECGAPPSEIMGEMPPGMELGSDGVPKMPDTHLVASIESFDQFKEVTGGDKLVIIDFWATWCGPCKVIGPVFEKLADKFPEIGFYKVDVDSQEEVAAEVGIKAMPTFILFKGGEKVGTVVGADPNKLKASHTLSSRLTSFREQALEHHKENSL
ncbi:hypothetical protein JCM8547_007355 [Rhodosporidiobolus lusitaniae]